MISYAPTVREYFERTAVPAEGGCRGEAGSLQQGTWIQLSFAVRDGQMENVAFRVFGCPHIIATCQRLTKLLNGAPLAVLNDFSPAELEQYFEIPAGKAGKLLILKDAMSACAQNIGGTGSA
jgi:hypothetical protein